MNAMAGIAIKNRALGSRRKNSRKVLRGTGGPPVEFSFEDSLARTIMGEPPMPRRRQARIKINNRIGGATSTQVNLQLIASPSAIAAIRLVRQFGRAAKRRP